VFWFRQLTKNVKDGTRNRLVEEIRNAHKILVEDLERKTPLGENLSVEGKQY
jgi:hypothetical protein